MESTITHRKVPSRWNRSHIREPLRRKPPEHERGRRGVTAEAVSGESGKGTDRRSIGDQSQLRAGGGAQNRRQPDLLCAAPAWLEESDAAEQTSEKSQRGGYGDLKKIKEKVKELQTEIHNRRGNSGKVRLMFQDEAGFGRINKPKYCWCQKGVRPSVPCHHIREYRYVYGAVEPATGESCFLVMPYCNTVCMNLFLRHLSKQFPDDIILLCCDGAAWHKSGTLCIPENIRLFFIPPYTPEMNPIEQIWKELRKRGFRNEIFASLDKVVLRLCDTICSLTSFDIFSITARSWILSYFY